jgi:hypothetical protein
MTSDELDAIEVQLAQAVQRARDLGWLDVVAKADPEPVHPSPTYRELERLSAKREVA